MSEAHDMLVEEVGSIRSDLADIEKRVDALEDVESPHQVKALKIPHN